VGKDEAVVARSEDEDGSDPAELIELLLLLALLLDGTGSGALAVIDNVAVEEVVVPRLRGGLGLLDRSVRRLRVRGIRIRPRERSRSSSPTKEEEEEEEARSRLPSSTRWEGGGERVSKARGRGETDGDEEGEAEAEGRGAEAASEAEWDGWLRCCGGRETRRGPCTTETSGWFGFTPISAWLRFVGSGSGDPPLVEDNDEAELDDEEAEEELAVELEEVRAERSNMRSSRSLSLGTAMRITSLAVRSAKQKSGDPSSAVSGILLLLLPTLLLTVELLFLPLLLLLLLLLLLEDSVGVDWSSAESSREE